MENKTTVAAIQCTLTDDEKTNLSKVASYVEQAAAAGAQIILPSELFEGHYFCTSQSPEYFSRARPAKGHPLLTHFSHLAKSLGVVLPISFFERDGQAHYNSVALIDEQGDIQGIYRKSHIPDGPGYSEKYYFNPGNTGFRVWKTQFGTIGVGICWDQWYPECARAMVLQGAEILFYPTAIGSEPGNPDPLATKDRWQRAMIGHAVSNVVPVVAANRTGTEGSQSYYGHSFIADETGTKLKEMPSGAEGFALASFDLRKIQEARAGWGFFRDRRPELYQPLLTQDGSMLPRC
jgi:N-carbamoylputrescine amidase